MEKINCTFDTLTQLRAAYLPFIRGGGLWVAPLPSVFIGDVVELHVTLLGRVYSGICRVVWVMPDMNLMGRPPGLGVTLPQQEELIAALQEQECVS